jgi:hypothetical protein
MWKTVWRWIMSNKSIVVLRGGPLDGEKMKLRKGPHGKFPVGIDVRVKGAPGRAAHYKRGDDLVWRFHGYKAIPIDKQPTEAAKYAQPVGGGSDLDLDAQPLTWKEIERNSFVYLPEGELVPDQMGWVLWTRHMKSGNYQQMGWFSSLESKPTSFPEQPQFGFAYQWQKLDWTPPKEQLAPGLVDSMIANMESKRQKLANVPMLEIGTGEITWMTPAEFRAAYRRPDGTLDIPEGFTRLDESEGRRLEKERKGQKG